jgi:hypothetical protein
MVLALAGLSTITKFLLIGRFSLYANTYNTQVIRAKANDFGIIITQIGAVVAGSCVELDMTSVPGQ